MGSNIEVAVFDSDFGISDDSRQFLSKGQKGN